MATRTHGERLDRLEQVVQVLAEDQLSLQKIVADLATQTQKGFDRVAAQFAESDRAMQELRERMRETDERMRETDKRMRATDERIEKLVSAIGELIRTRNGRT